MTMTPTEREALCKRIMQQESSNFLTWLDTELARLGDKDDNMQAAMNQDIRELALVFSTQGHSGFSASYLRHMLHKVLAWEPLTPLTGENDEWNEVGPGVFQNKRCGRVFKEGVDGQAYDSEGKVFRDKNGNCWSGRDSSVPVTFPYTPTTVVEDRDV